jgi:hypothetical protein
MYFPQNWEFGSALSKLRNIGAGFDPLGTTLVRIDVGPFTTFLRRWELVMGHANGF